MCESLQSSINEYKQINYQSKLLLLFSDGIPTDGDPIPLSDELKKMNVIIVTCFLTDKDIQSPRTLYSEEIKEWDAPAKLMFNMSSEISNST
jgi:hypothetical protein